MLLKNAKQRLIGFGVTIVILIVLMSISIVYGYTNTTWQVSFNAFTNFDGSTEHIVIRTVRLPRALIAAAVGASLAIAGVLMQALTKNPLSSPDILGVNAGAALAVVIAITIFGVSNLQLFTWVSFIGAAIAAISVYMIGSVGRDGLTPMKLTLAGAAMTAMIASLTQGLLVSNEALLDQVLFWLAGSVAGRSLDNLVAVLPYLVLGWVLAQLVSGKVNVFSMGKMLQKDLG